MTAETLKFFENQPADSKQKEKPEDDDKIFSSDVSRSFNIKSRRKAREAALQALYGCETVCDWSAATIHSYFEQFHNLELATLGAGEGALRFCLELIEGVVLHGLDIDKLISQASENWPIERMPRTDRNILRIAVFEICYLKDVPVSVTLNEAVEISKVFCGDDSHKFINALLNKLIQRSDLRDNFPILKIKLKTT